MTIENTGELKPQEIAEQAKVTGLKQALLADWSGYYQLLNNLSAEYQLAASLRLLDAADGVLNRDKQLQDTSIQERFMLAGIEEKKQTLDSGLLGDMSGFASFKKVLKNDPQGLSKLMKVIPSTGPIDGWHFSQFIDTYQMWFADNGFKQTQLFPATRLLSMKRPDQFVALSEATASIFYQAFEIKPLKKQDFQRYWDEIILPIQKTQWFNAYQPMDAAELPFFRGRVVLLDRLAATASSLVNPVESLSESLEASSFNASLSDSSLNDASENVSSEKLPTDPESSAIASATRKDTPSQKTTYDFIKQVERPVVAKTTKQPKKMTIAKRKSAKLNQKAATALMSQYYFANKAKLTKLDVKAQREVIIERIVAGESVEEVFEQLLAKIKIRS